MSFISQDTCTMPEHGQPDAKAACCRPKNTNHLEDTASPESFWTDSTAWKKALSNTFNCLIGCSIGNFSVLFFLQATHPHLPMHFQMILAMSAGLLSSIILETLILKIKEEFSWLHALKTAFSMSFISMVAMEFAEVATDVAMTGGKVDFTSTWWWFALGVSLVAGFLAPLPYNYWKFKKHGVSCH